MTDNSTGPPDAADLLQSAAVPYGWQAIENHKQIDDLMSLFGNFHDACVRELHVVTGHFVDESLSMDVDWKATAHMLIQRQYRPFSVIEFRFEEVVGLHVSTMAPGCVNIVYDAAFFVQDGVYYWADNGAWTPDSSSDSTWVAARKVFWRDASEWLGPNLRYRKNTG